MPVIRHSAADNLRKAAAGDQADQPCAQFVRQMIVKDWGSVCMLNTTVKLELQV